MTDRMSRRFADLATTEVERLDDRSVLLLPVGAVEQHGPHLPLATDLLLVDAVCDAVVAARGDELDLWRLPSLAYGRSIEHVSSAGTLTLSTSTLLTVLDELAAGVAATPARRLALVNGHGGNTPALLAAARDLRLRHGLLTFVLRPFAAPGPSEGAEREAGLGLHAGHVETSLMLHTRPDLVRMELAEREIPRQGFAGEASFGGRVAFGWLSQDLTDSGVVGDPTGATADEGAKLFDRIVGRLGDDLADVRAFAFPPRAGEQR
jgi:creatinine amidohydrolase